MLGHSLEGRYRIVERLARGGMATVYKAIDTRLTRTVAVKVMHVGLGDDTEFARKFDREARAAARLSHPCVVSVFDQGTDDGRPYIVMEYVEGPTLRDVINREAPLPPQRALELIEPVLSALAAAHEAGLIHRDVKPENVLITPRGQLKVADFGLAKAITAQTSTATQGLLIGTVSYLPPELVMSGKADARSDVYSAGIVLFELLTGRKPHTGDTPIQVAYAHVHKDVPPPSSFRTAGPIPPYVDALIARATARDPDLRPRDAKIMLSQVRRVRTALREGIADDPELTEDLSGILAVRASAEETTEPQPGAGSPFETLDPRADFRAPMFVPASPTSPRSPASPYEPFAGTIEHTPPRTVLDAPPPGVPPRDDALLERVGAERDRRRRRRRRGLIVLLLVLMLTASAALAGWYLTEGRFTTAPALENLSQAEAQAVVDKAGLSVSFDHAYSETTPVGLVSSTDPGPGSRVREGGQLVAYLSKGPERHPMPTVAGLSVQAATAAIEGASLAVGKVNETFSDAVAKGMVIGAAYKPGTSLKPETAVDLMVSTGPKPITVTDFTGKSADDAEKALEQAGFKVTREKKNSDQVDKGLVIAQDPAKGTGFKGDEITLTVSDGPVMVTVPNVRAMGTKAAESVMRKAGFKVRVRAVKTNYLGLGYVAYTNPGARTSAPKGSTITLYVV
ncbi:Stk1 family PASTA domain-containing Ser/Thr kinase [Microlunatus ginsengisoli]|uniref:non-specific serine/threonine protein kinase n=1 Tax=Microlunatus ginsengisoli TaxID=363863 RepID=A0ABP7ABA6_9ACTN